MQGARNRYSDKEKFRGAFNRPESCEISERFLTTLQNSGDFQAEYEGSIPFNRAAKGVVRAATAASPRRRYPTGKVARQISMLRRLLPEKMFDKLFRKQMRVPV